MIEGHGDADYLLFVDRKAVGVIEAKKKGSTLTGVEWQSAKYTTGLPEESPRPEAPSLRLRVDRGGDPLYQRLRPRARKPAGVHVPPPRDPRRRSEHGRVLCPEATLASSSCPRSMDGLVGGAGDGDRNLEQSLVHFRPRALIQMATGSGKTFIAANVAYRLIKFAGARRVLFLVDRANLGRQTLKEFQRSPPPTTGESSPSSTTSSSSGRTASTRARVVISTIQRLYSKLKGEPISGQSSTRTPASELNPSNRSRSPTTRSFPSRPST